MGTTSIARIGQESSTTTGTLIIIIIIAPLVFGPGGSLGSPVPRGERTLATRKCPSRKYLRSGMCLVSCILCAKYLRRTEGYGRVEDDDRRNHQQQETDQDVEPDAGAERPEMDDNGAGMKRRR